MDIARLYAFAGTWFLIALSPGLCMTLSMSLGIAVGVRRTMWMMLGELAGIALVGAAAMLGVAALLLASPVVFTAFKLGGSIYLIWMAIKTWRSPPGKLMKAAASTPAALATQGFVTAVSNPKAWAFNMALLPPFINPNAPLAPQMAVLLTLMIAVEFVSLMIYAQGGRALSEILLKRGKGAWLNRAAALLMFGVALWLVFG